MSENTFDELVKAVTEHPKYRAAVQMAQEMDELEHMVETAKKTKLPAYIRVASEMLEAFRAKWFEEKEKDG